MLDPDASVPEVAAFLAAASLAEIEAELPTLVSDHGAFWATIPGGLSTFTLAGLSASSTESVAEAAQIWGDGYLHGFPPADLLASSKVLEIATYLSNRSLAEIERVMPALVVGLGAFWFTTTSGISTFTARGLSASSTHSPAEAARIWGLGYLTGDLEPAAQPAGPAGMAGIVGTMLDPFFVNKGAR